MDNVESAVARITRRGESKATWFRDTVRRYREFAGYSEQEAIAAAHREAYECGIEL